MTNHLQGVSRLPSVPNDEPMQALDVSSRLFDYLVSGKFPNTLFKLPMDGSIIVDVTNLVGVGHLKDFDAALEEIGDRTGRKNTWHIDPLPRARIWAQKRWGFIYEPNDATEWATPK